MSYWSEKEIELSNRRYKDPPRKYVCAEAFGKQHILVDHIATYGHLGVCDYTGKKTNVVLLEEIIEIIIKQFEKYFEDPAEECYFESSREFAEDMKNSGFCVEGAGYLMRNDRPPLSTKEALEYLCFYTATDELFDDIAKCFLWDFWVLIDPYEDTPSEKAQYSWDKFAEETIALRRQGMAYDDIKQNCQQHISGVISLLHDDMNLYLKVLNNENLFRCVNYPSLPDPITPSHMWAPPAVCAKEQRMSHAYQSRFYAAFSKNVCLKEAVKNNDNEIGLVGNFTLMHPINVLDLCRKEHCSFLDCNQFWTADFLRHFAKEISQDTQHDKYRYTPTQIVSDTINELFPHISGIMYTSCKVVGESNVVLFMDNQSCANNLTLDEYEVV